MDKSKKSRGYFVQSERSADVLFGDSWRELSSNLRQSIEQVMEIVEHESLSSSKQGLARLFEKQDLIGGLFPPYLIVNKFSDLLSIEESNSPSYENVTRQNERSKNITPTYEGALDSYNDIIRSVQAGLELALLQFSERFNEQKNKKETDREILRAWIECAEQTHRDMILTDEFAEKFGACINYLFQQTDSPREKD